MDTNHIRNFSIVAHIDHGKSTLADKLLSFTGSISERESGAQFLDTMDLEQERGITIKARTVRLRYHAKNGEEYYLNLIDTPGHVDFSYEVSRSLSACEGAILVVDASQGVEAQTLANAYLALDNHLELLPVINKIDLPSAEPERVRKEIEDVIGLDGSDAVLASAKEGRGIAEVLEGIVRAVPPPGGDEHAPLKALLFDSWFDTYQGAVILVRVFDGVVRQGMTMQLMSSGKLYEIQRVGVFAPKPLMVTALGPGEVGFVMAGIKEVTEARVGDTLTDPANPTPEPFPGFKAAKPMVFAGLYPVDSSEYETLRDAVEKLRLNDAAFSYEKESSLALGFGFRCGFLGLLHMEIVQERLEREFGLDLITTTPTVEYRVVKLDGETLLVENPALLPSEQEIAHIEEPFILATIHVPTEYLGNVLQLCQERRGIQRELKYPGVNRVMVQYELPLNEIVIDFHDRLKSVSRGYASFDYEYLELRPAKMVKLDIRINGDIVDALSLIVHEEQAYTRGRELTQKMRELIPRQMYEVALQASVGGRIIARETVKALRKNVTAKCYGGDITRKRKLLEKQKEGKRRMKQVGRVEVPQEAFLALLRVRDS
ncbi:MAG: elongation factor 4 [Deltaproteobacteria bacterium]|nr:elongation factor 4 [Deltaproteobacteria bacterium]